MPDRMNQAKHAFYEAERAFKAGIPSRGWVALLKMQACAAAAAFQKVKNDKTNADWEALWQPDVQKIAHSTGLVP